MAHIGNLEPAVPVEDSVFPDRIVCLECGMPFKVLKRHLLADHELSVEAYRQRFRLTRAYPLVAPDYTKIRSEMLKRSQLGRAAALKTIRQKRA
jgi:predicted transcriptional regulator